MLERFFKFDPNGKSRFIAEIESKNTDATNSIITLCKTELAYLLSNKDERKNVLKNIHRLIAANQTDILDKLAAAINYDSYFFICDSEQTEISDFNPNAPYLSYIAYSAALGNIDTLKLAAAHGVNFNIALGHYPPIFYSIAKSKAECAEYLLQNGADLFAFADDGATALQIACFYRADTEILGMLVKNGCNVNSTKGIFDNYSVATNAILGSNPIAMEFLIKNGADVLKSDDFGKHPIDYATTGTKIYNMLLDIEKAAN